MKAEKNIVFYGVEAVREGACVKCESLQMYRHTSTVDKCYDCGNQQPCKTSTHY